MQAENNTPNYELVKQAFRALRQATTEEPSEDSLLRAITVAGRAAMQPRFTFAERIYAMPPSFRAIVGVGAIAASIAGVVLLLLPGSKAIAWTQVVDQIRSARRISFRVDQRWANPQRPGITTRVWSEEPDKSRVEWTIGDRKTVSILNGQKTLSLDGTQRVALLGEIPPGRAASTLQAVDELRSLIEKDGKPVGEEVLNGVRTKVFEAEFKDRKVKLWANAKTGALIRIEYPLTEIPPPDGPGQKTLSDFNVDARIDEALFRLDVPEGYEVATVESLHGTPPVRMIAILRSYAKATGGEFPQRFDDQGASVRSKLNLPKERSAMTLEQKELAAHLDNIVAQLGAAGAAERLRYYPGVKLGEKDRVVFWSIDAAVTGTFQPLVPNPNASAAPAPQKEPQKYSVIYGDLHVEHVPKDQLPAAPK
jgi:outer membrane lipoprotein-sorting protein